MSSWFDRITKKAQESTESETNGYYPTPYPPTPPSQITFIFNGINTGLCGNYILEYIFGVGSCENNIINEINNGMINGM